MSRFEVLNQIEKNEVKEMKHQSQFDFEKFEIEDEEIKNEISQKEEEIMVVAKQLAKKTLELGKLLYETQQILSNNKTGTFAAWFSYMGLEKTFVYREISRWEMFLKYKNPQIAEASIRTIDFIKKNEDLEDMKVSEILKNPKQAPEKIKEIKTEVLEDLKENLTKEEELEKLDNKIKKLEEKLEKLKLKREEILDR